MKKPYYLTTFRITVLSGGPVAEELTRNFYEAITDHYIPEVRVKKEKQLTPAKACAYLEACGLDPNEDQLPRVFTIDPVDKPTPPKPPSRARSSRTPDTASP